MMTLEHKLMVACFVIAPLSWLLAAWLQRKEDPRPTDVLDPPAPQCARNYIP